MENENRGTVTINGMDVIVIDRKFFKEMVRDEALRLRNDQGKGLVSVAEACHILGVKAKKFYRLYSDPKTEIKRSKIQGKYTRRSIERELMRLSDKL